MTALNRNSRICIYAHGGFSGGSLIDPVDITLDRIPDDSFKAVKEIIDLMLSGHAPLEPDWGSMTFDEIDKYADKSSSCYRVKIGPPDAAFEDLSEIFNNGQYALAPPHILELETLLKEHARPQDLALKP